MPEFVTDTEGKMEKLKVDVDQINESEVIRIFECEGDGGASAREAMRARLTGVPLDRFGPKMGDHRMKKIEKERDNPWIRMNI